MEVSARFDGHVILFVVWESNSQADVNMDGDTLGAVLHVYDGETGTVHAILDGPPFSFAARGHAWKRRVVFHTNPVRIFDDVIFIHEPETGETTNTGFAGRPVVHDDSTGDDDLSRFVTFYDHVTDELRVYRGP